MKVYIVTQPADLGGDWIVAVFSTEEKAAAYAEGLRYVADIQEFEVDERDVTEDPA